MNRIIPPPNGKPITSQNGKLVVPDAAAYEPSALLGGLTPQQFMRKHWQKKPLLVRQAVERCREFAE